MKRFALIFSLVAMLLVVGCSGKKADTATTEAAQGSDEITLTDVTSIDDILAAPATYVGKTVLIEGVVSGRCGGSGCWISFQVGDNQRGLVVTTKDESWVFPECVGKTVQVQGTLQVKNADEIAEAEKHAMEEGHECPNPVYFFQPEAVKVVETAEEAPEAAEAA